MQEVVQHNKRQQVSKIILKICSSKIFKDSFHRFDIYYIIILLNRYLKEELQDSVSDELLEAFTQSSADDIDWLRKQGVPINETNENAKCFSGKASMPPPEYT